MLLCILLFFIWLADFCIPSAKKSLKKSQDICRILITDSQAGGVLLTKLLTFLNGDYHVKKLSDTDAKNLSFTVQTLGNIELFNP